MTSHLDADPDLVAESTAAPDRAGGIGLAAESETTGDLAKPKPMGVLFWISVGWLALNVVLAIFANLLPMPGPNAEDYNAINANPSASHWLGTDDLGRDILSRLIYGSRISLTIGFVSIAIGLAIGGTLALISAYRRGNVDLVLNSSFSVLQAFPALVALIAILAFWRPIQEYKIFLIIGILSSPLLYRVIRASTLSYVSREFITAARSLGATTSRILWREVLPNVAPTIVSYAILGVATVIIIEGALAFLGLSIPPPAASWGNMLNEGRNQLEQPGAPLWLLLFPALALLSFLLALNFVGDRLRQRFDIGQGNL